MGRGVESRFERYAEKMVQALGHADRATPARWYLRGLMLPGQRKSVEPMAARVHPQDVGSAHQSMHHLVADSDWSDTALLAAVAARGGAGAQWSRASAVFLDHRRHELSQVGQALGRGGAPVLRALGQDGELPGRGESDAGHARKGVCRSTTGCICRRSGPGTRSAAGLPACPEESALPPKARSRGRRSKRRSRQRCRVARY